jgi:hypothetical protein
MVGDVGSPDAEVGSRGANPEGAFSGVNILN